jgi:hypothetical protein
VPFAVFELHPSSEDRYHADAKPTPRPVSGKRIYSRARFLIQIGAPINPNASRIWFSRNR